MKGVFWTVIITGTMVALVSQLYTVFTDFLSYPVIVNLKLHTSHGLV